jgi:dCMP deaminase
MEICRAVHAEQNAIIQAALHGVELGPPGLKAYCTYSPCVTCAKLLIQAGVEEILVREIYPDDLAQQMLAEAGVALTVIGKGWTTPSLGKGDVYLGVTDEPA